MAKLDEIKPTHKSGLYKLEILVEGQWVAAALVSKEAIIDLSTQLDELSDRDVEAVDLTEGN